jgi:hypothetical protein
MKVRHCRLCDKGEMHHHLNGWMLVAALGVIAVAGVATMLVTGSTNAVTAVVTPLLLVLGITAVRE